ncbi:uncharacterized protein LAESUDRAFT_757554 [Laetiporus sulphureus 93-53]|uniref:Retrotransposon gag domain-containing protein n=1 Tax=Laetiporus sulphureus 93-53 TaxID=1314785 RepID=A0A165F3K3_9APHY|nr:uncharacterized protein LAESUDRAFT_757554 [Laetiporus sulphureus 93-53]KZT08307.1 hypothetical protein LAESUDRAFT_757554 [Laetiporus sulphureus 93-53]
MAQSEHSVEGHLNPENLDPRAPTPSSFNNTDILAPTPRYFMTPAMLEALPTRRGPSARLVEEFAALYPEESRTGRRFHQWEYDIHAREHSVEDRQRYRTQPVDVVARHGGAARGQDYVWSSHASGTPPGYERYRFPDNRQSYYLARPGLPPPNEDVPGFWTQPTDMRRAYQHLQNDYNRLRSRLDVARREVAEAREGRLAAEATRDRLMRQVDENEASRTERGNQIHKLTTELEAFKKALKSSEERVTGLEGINKTQETRIHLLEAMTRPPPQDPGQQDIRDWVKGVGGTAGPSGLKPAHQANPEQPPSRVQTPPMSPAHSYKGDEDDELAGALFAFPPEWPVPPPDRDRRSAAPPPASSDEVHRKSFRGPKVNLPEPFDGTKAKAKAWLVDVMNYIVMKPSEFEDEQSKIRWAMSYIRGPQIDHWKASLLERMMGGPPVYATLQDFIADFKKMYYPANPELEGQRMLRSMQQRYKPWEEFEAEWEHWVKVSGYKDEQLLLQLLRTAMRKELCDRVWSSEGISRDVNSYSLWKQVAARLDLQQQQQWASTFEDRKGKGKAKDSRTRQVHQEEGSTTVTANAVRTTGRAPIRNIDEAGKAVPHKETVGVENERDKHRKCGTCGKERSEKGSCTDIWHTHYYDGKAQCWRKKDAQPAARASTVEETEAVRAFKAAIAANPALLNQAGFQFGKA